MILSRRSIILSGITVVAAGALRWWRSAHPRDEARPRFWLVFWTLAPCCAASVVPLYSSTVVSPVTKVPATCSIATVFAFCKARSTLVP